MDMAEIRRENCGEVALTCFSSFDTGFGSNPKARYESLVGRLRQILLQRPKLRTARIELNRPRNRPPRGRALAGLQLGLSEQKIKFGVVRRMLQGMSKKSGGQFPTVFLEAPAHRGCYRPRRAPDRAAARKSNSSSPCPFPAAPDAGCLRRN